MISSLLVIVWWLLLVVGFLAGIVIALIAGVRVAEAISADENSDLHKVEWLFPLRGRWLRYVFATLAFLVVAPVVFLVVTTVLFSILYSICMIVGPILSGR